MKLINERVLIRNVASAWLDQYPRARQLRDETYLKLHTLDVETATAKDVNTIIGNASWTVVPHCNECGASVPAVVEIGEEPDYESATAYVCLACLRKALALFTEEIKP